MDPQVISVAAGVVSVAIAALGLLLAWYRREGEKEDDKEERRRQQVFRGASLGIVALSAIGVIFTFILGAGSNSTDTESTASVTSSTIKISDGSMQLSKAQYKGRVGQACSDAMEKGQRLSELRARETVLGAAVNIEKEELDEVSKLQPPKELEALHEDMVSVWERRISLLESVYQRLPEGDEGQIEAELTKADQLAEELARHFRALDLPECIM